MSEEKKICEDIELGLHVKAVDGALMIFDVDIVEAYERDDQAYFTIRLISGDLKSTIDPIYNLCNYDTLDEFVDDVYLGILGSIHDLLKAWDDRLNVDSGERDEFKHGLDVAFEGLYTKEGSNQVLDLLKIYIAEETDSDTVMSIEDILKELGVYDSDEHGFCNGKKVMNILRGFLNSTSKYIEVK